MITEKDVEKILAESIDVDPARIRVGPTFFDPDDFSLRKNIFLDNRKMRVMWSPELAQDLRAIHGSHEAEAELIQVLVEQFREEWKAMAPYR